MPDPLPALAPYGPFLFLAAVALALAEEVWHLRRSWLARQQGLEAFDPALAI
jgi:hypothetical protein